MFGITRKHIQPILNSIRQFPSTVPIDTDKIGAWGIVFLCCGAMAARNPAWVKKLIGSHADIEFSTLIRIMKGRDNKSDKDYVIKFSEYIEQWCNDNYAAAVAHEWMKKYRSRFNPSILEYYATYIQLAYCINKFQDMQLEELLNGTDKKNMPGWPELFFAAGFILSNEEKVKWQQMASSIHSMSGSHKKNVAALFRHYTGENEFWKLEITGIQTDQIKKGMRVRTLKRRGIHCVKKCDENSQASSLPCNSTGNHFFEETGETGEPQSRSMTAM